MHTVSIQPAHDVPEMSPEGPLNVLMSGTYRGPLGDSQENNTKIYDLMIKLYFRSNCFLLHVIYCFLQDPVVGRPGDQMMGRSWNVRGTSVKHVFQIQLTNTLNSL